MNTLIVPNEWPQIAGATIRLVTLPSGRVATAVQLQNDADEPNGVTPAELERLGFSRSPRSDVLWVNVSDTAARRLISELPQARRIAFDMDLHLLDMLGTVQNVASQTVDVEEQDNLEDSVDQPEINETPEQESQAVELPSPGNASDPEPVTLKEVDNPPSQGAGAQDSVANPSQRTIDDVGDVRGFARKDIARLGMLSLIHALQKLDINQHKTLISRDSIWPKQSPKQHKSAGRSIGAAIIYDSVHRTLHTDALTTGKSGRIYHHSDERVRLYSLAVRWAREEMDAVKTLQEAIRSAHKFSRAFRAMSVRISSYSSPRLGVGSEFESRTVEGFLTFVAENASQASTRELAKQWLDNDLADLSRNVRLMDSFLQDKWSGKRRWTPPKRASVKALPTAPVIPGLSLMADFFDGLIRENESESFTAEDIKAAIKRRAPGDDADPEHKANWDKLLATGIGAVVELQDPTRYGELLMPVGEGIAQARRTEVTEGVDWSHYNAAIARTKITDPVPEETEADKWRKTLTSLRTYREAHDPQAKIEQYRKGPATDRQGRDISGEDLMKIYGFRGIEYGNWVPQKERQAHLNMIYDAFHDLCLAMNIPRTAVSLGGMLGLCVGSRGRGGRRAPMAHFEPSNFAINLTRMNGIGALAHEWAHGIDHYLTGCGSAVSRSFDAEYESENHFVSHFSRLAFASQEDAIATPLPQGTTSEGGPAWRHLRGYLPRPPVNNNIERIYRGIGRRIKLRPVEQVSDLQLRETSLRMLDGTFNPRGALANRLTNLRQLARPYKNPFSAKRDQKLQEALIAFADATDAFTRQALKDFDEHVSQVSESVLQKHCSGMAGGARPEFQKEIDLSLAKFDEPGMTAQDRMNWYIEARARPAEKMVKSIREWLHSPDGQGASILQHAERYSGDVSRRGFRAWQDLKMEINNLSDTLEKTETEIRGFRTFAQEPKQAEGLDTDLKLRTYLWTSDLKNLRTRLTQFQSTYFQADQDEQAWTDLLSPIGEPDYSVHSNTEFVRSQEFLRDLHRNIGASSFDLSSHVMDKERASRARYWSTGREQFARAFECAIRQILCDKGIENTYLSSARAAPDLKPTDYPLLAGTNPSAAAIMAQAFMVSAYPRQTENDGMVASFTQYKDALRTVHVQQPDANGELQGRAMLYSHDARAIENIDLLDLTDEQRAMEAASQVERMIGDAARVYASPTNAEVLHGAAGAYVPSMPGFAPTILLATQDLEGRKLDILPAAFHESMHAALDQLYHTEELMILYENFAAQNNRPWFRQLAAAIQTHITDPKRRADVMHAVNNNPGEAVCYAFQFWKTGEMAKPKADTVLGRLWDRFKLFAERVRNVVHGHGFKSVSDLLGALDAGELAQRAKHVETFGQRDQSAHHTTHSPQSEPMPVSV